MITYFSILRIRNILIALLLLKTVRLCLPAGAEFYPFDSVFYYKFVFICFGVYFFLGKVSFRIDTPFILFFVCIIYYLIALFVTFMQLHSINKSVIVDLANILCFLLLWCMVDDLEVTAYQDLMNTFLKFAVYLSFIIACLSFYKFYLLLNGVELEWVPLNAEDAYPWGTSLVPDDNFYCLGILTGLVSSWCLIRKKESFGFKLFTGVNILLLTLCVLFAGSRRGIVALISFIIYAFIKKRSSLRLFIRELFKRKWYCVIILSLILIAFSNYNIIAGYVVDNYEKITFIFERYFTIIIGTTEDPQALGARVERLTKIEDILMGSTFLELLLGNGFEYFKMLDGDYPHNLFISTLFYSGIVGTIMLFFLYAYVILQAINKRRLLGEVFLWIFFFTCFFYFFSDNSLFSSSTYMIMAIIIFRLQDKPLEGKINALNSGRNGRGTPSPVLITAPLSAQ
jgi:hypothetical protein